MLLPQIKHIESLKTRRAALVGRIQAITFRADSEDEEEQGAAPTESGEPSCSLSIGHDERVKRGEMTPFGTMAQVAAKPSDMVSWAPTLT